MKKQNFLFLFSLLAGVLVFFPPSLQSQLVIGQYEDEAPFRTWNSFGIQTAPVMAMGEIQFTIASDSSTSLSNPALLFYLPKVTFTINASVSSTSFFKYSFVNTGVLTTERNAMHRYTAFDFAGVSYRVKNWAFALSWAQIEDYDRPVVQKEYIWRGYTYRILGLIQKGSLKNVNFSISRKIAKFLSLGVGFNFVYGLLERDVSDEWVMDNVTITNNMSHEFSGYYFNGGMCLSLTERLDITAVFRTPYVKNSKSKSLHRYYAPDGQTDIRIEADSRSKYNQPLVFGVGAGYRISGKLRMATEFTFFRWSEYSGQYFEEPLQRNFRDVVKMGLGVEYVDSFKLWNREFEIPFRGGFVLDPQPMKDPRSNYYYLTLGTGLHTERFLLDTSMMIGEESGSGYSLKASRAALSLSYRF